MAAPVDRFLDAVRETLGAAHVLTDPELVAGYDVDWTGRFRGRTPAVVRPADTGEVAAVVHAARREHVALVPQGGNTGLVGGSVPLEGEVVVSLRRLTSIGPVDAIGGQVTAGAGVTIADLDGHARAAGWAYGVDWGARDSATVGGSIATDAGGVRFVRHGGTRRQLLGVTAVLGTGAVISHLVGLEKDNTGYDLAGLLCGSEGTLGIVTAARLRLVAAERDGVVALLAFATTHDAVVATGPLRRLPGVDAIELIVGEGLRLAQEALGLTAPFPVRHAAHLLVEVTGAGCEERLAAAVEDLTGVADAAVALEPARRDDLWRLREAQAEAIATLGAPHKLDVTLPAPALAEFLDEVPAVVESIAPDARTWLFGHAADGNVHVNVTGLDPDDESVDDAVLALVAARGGSISAEHGIGTAKVPWLHLNRSPAEIEAMRAIKAALDPDGILNPGVLLPPA